MSYYSPFGNLKQISDMPPVVSTGMIYHYDINNTSSYPGSGTSLTDLSGNGYSSTLTGSYTYTGGTPSTLTFVPSGRTYTTNVNAFKSTTDNYTVSGWVKWSTNGTRKYIVCRGQDKDAGAFQYGWSISLEISTSNVASMSVTTTKPSIGTETFNGVTSLSVDTWYFITGIWKNGTGWELYVNGVLDASGTTTKSTIRDAETGFKVWQTARFNNANYSSIVIGRVLTYNRALTSDEVFLNYNATAYIYGYSSDPVLSKGFTTEWTVAGDATARTITLPTPTGYTYNYYVNWGDGSAVQNITTYNGGTHTYSNDGTYWVEITGECPAWSQFQNPVEADRVKITDIIYWGNPSKFNGFKNILWGFYGCTNLKSFGRGKIIASSTGWYSGNALFAGCSGITSPIPAGIFDNCTNMSFDSTFTGCSNVVGSIPADLFKFNINAANFFATFNGCSKITGPIPADLFKYNVNVSASGFRATFASTSITEIPTDLFRYNTGVTTNAFYQTFYNCTRLTSIPTDLFRYNTLVSVGAFYGTFYNCNALTTIPTDLFRYNTAVSTSGFYQTFAYCDNLATVPANLFKYNTSADSFYQAFVNDTKLVVNKNIFYADGEQSTRFLNKSVDFRNCFSRPYFDGASQGTAPDLWACSFGTGTATSTGCYAGNGNNTTSLSNYASIPAAWK